VILARGAKKRLQIVLLSAISSLPIALNLCQIVYLPWSDPAAFGAAFGRTRGMIVLYGTVQ
jgi:hypothetical protein